MKTINKKILAAVTAGLFCAGSLGACTSNEAASEKADDTKAEAAAEGAAEGAPEVNARPDECGLQEQEGPTTSFGIFDAAVMYFQPGQMAENPNSTMKMLDYKDSQMHIELDLKANAYATNWGYSVDETPANLTIKYLLTDKDGQTKSEGMMMPMNAIDGSHYGTNLAKDTITEPGDYKLKITIFPPSNYDIHSDYITGVPADAWFKPLTQEMDWKIEQENLDAVKENTVDNPMEPGDNCKKYPKKMYENKDAAKTLEEAEKNEPLKK